jgi:hypothetical protein
MANLGPRVPLNVLLWRDAFLRHGGAFGRRDLVRVPDAFLRRGAIRGLRDPFLLSLVPMTSFLVPCTFRSPFLWERGFGMTGSYRFWTSLA